MSNAIKYPIGSVSHGTMRSEDLFDAFTSELESLDGTRFAKFQRENRDLFDIEDYDEMDGEQTESVGFAVESLFDILNEFAGPYFYFGAHPGDGSDYGFWFDEDSFNEAVRCGEIHKCDELPENLDDLDCEYVAVISDHGNITLYDINGQEVWGIV